MTAYEMMIKTNHYLIKGGELTESQKQNVVRQLMTARTTSEHANRFYIGVKYPNNTDNEGHRMYPLFFIPPFNNGKKYKTVLNQTPKTSRRLRLRCTMRIKHYNSRGKRCILSTLKEFYLPRTE